MRRLTQASVGVNVDALIARGQTVRAVEPCRRCGRLGVAWYGPEGWDFRPFSGCGDLKCSEKPNGLPGRFAIIGGGRA
jgi:hypothetical protein